MPRITRKLEFDAGHRVLGHEGKCRHLHGHRYVAEITVDANQLDDLGRVVDFGVVKQLVGKWVDDNFDHNLLLHPHDPFWKVISEELVGGRMPFIMPNGNPTAENIAEMLFGVAEELLKPYNLRVAQVRVYETPNCWATYIPQESRESLS